MNVLTANPTSNGDKQELSCSGTHWQAVSDDSDATYVYRTGNTYATDLYRSTQLNLPSDAKVVLVVVGARVEDHASSSYIFVKGALKIGSSEYYSDEYTTNSTDWHTFTANWNKSPATGNDWTASEVNNLQFGVSMYRDSTFPMARASEIWLEVYYTDDTTETILARSTGSGDRTEFECSGNPVTYAADGSMSTYLKSPTSISGNPYAHLFTSSQLSLPSGVTTINSVTVFSIVKMASAVTNGGGGVILKSGSTESLYTPSLVGTEQYWHARYYTWTTNPATGSPFLPASISSLQFGVTGNTGSSYNTVRAPETWIVVEFDLPAQRNGGAPLMW